jgi:hypothetical protein
MKKIAALILLTVSGHVYAQKADTTQTVTNDLFDLSLEELLKIDMVDKNFYLYGYINSNLQKTFNYPSIGPSGETQTASDPYEWDPVRNFHIYGKGNFTGKISYLFNLARNNDFLEIRNAYGNFGITDAFQIRVGKMYRKFGLYNERLDQIPTFIGIEAPEMLDADHLFLMRTTNLMVHGEFQNPRRVISYALMTDNGEGGPKKGVVSLGWDVRYKSYVNSLIVGTSGYSSSISNNNTTSTVDFASGSPQGGILPWMDGDRFNVMGVFVEKQIGKLLIQSEYYNAAHTAERNPEMVLALINNAGLNPSQRDRFLDSGENLPDALLSEANVQRNVKYNVQTWYIRLGYNIQSAVGQFVPYLFLDWMSHPEAIRSKDFGGDDESGLADDGKFWKPSVGLVYRPLPNVAVKLDGSYHIQNFNGKSVSYPEIRLDFSFAFSNNQLDKVMGN